MPLSREFDYRPVEGQRSAEPGCRVIVPFGRRRQVGIVMDVAADSDLPVGKLRQCIAAPDDAVLLSAEDLKLLRFTAEYYHHPIGEVVAAALPAMLRHGKPLFASHTCFAITDAGAQADIETLARRAPRQAELLELLQDAGGNGIAVDALTEHLPNWRRAAKPLLEKGLATRFESRAELPDPSTGIDPQPGPRLNADQQRALSALRARDGFGVFLLDGVTGSGKTEVYLQRITDVLAADRQVLILVPEIGTHHNSLPASANAWALNRLYCIPALPTWNGYGHGSLHDKVSPNLSSVRALPCLRQCRSWGLLSWTRNMIIR